MVAAPAVDAQAAGAGNVAGDEWPGGEAVGVPDLDDSRDERGSVR